MQERQVTIGENTYVLDKPFIVIATQNPIEQQGTYPLPEAQQDRFMMKLKIQHPNREEEKRIIERFSVEQAEAPEINRIFNRDNLSELQKQADSLYLDEKIQNYVLDIVFKTRETSNYITCGASPRASLYLVKAAKARAFLEGRSYVVPDDIKAIVYDVLRHRILLTYEAEAENITTEMIITQILEQVNLP